MQQTKTCVLLINLGSPASLDVRQIRKYLREFLSDRRVIETNRLIWYPILYGIVLNLRPRKTAANYSRIWNHELNASPLLLYTESQTNKLQDFFDKNYKELGIKFFWCMRYGSPSITDICEQIMSQGYEKVILLPLFPQYSGATIGSVFELFFKYIAKLRYIPAVSTINSFATHPKYINNISQSLISHIKKLDFAPDAILVSFHGIPKSYCEKGDPYFDECRRSFNAIKSAVNTELPQIKLQICFQSRFGNEEWLQPYASDLMQNLPKNNVKNIVIISPGFISDCLETIDEINRELREEFIHSGGENFSYVPCLNDSSAAIDLLTSLCTEHLNLEYLNL